MTATSRVLVVEEEPARAAAAKRLLRAARFEVCIANDSGAARAVLGAIPRDGSRFDAIVLDLDGLDDDALELVRCLAAHAPVLVSATARSDATILETLRAGASGYLFREDAQRRLPSAVQELLGGGAPLSAGAARALLDRLRRSGEREVRHDPSLTPRERDVLRELARGLTYEEVARTLEVSTNTVRAHVRSLYEKLGVATRTEAVMTGLRLGLVTV
jgi:DNA-binding NarL/FixJ family response regulator